MFVCSNKLNTAYEKASEISDDKLMTLLSDDKNIVNKALSVLKANDYEELSDYFTSVKYKNFPAAGKIMLIPKKDSS